jgi:hypothetical protein
MHVFASPIDRLLATRARVAALAVVVVAAVSVAYASIPDSAGVIHGCYNKNNGQLRVIDDAVSSCAPSESSLAWSQTGPQGPTGAQGPEGPQGPAGPEGPSGSTAFGGFREVGGGTEGLPDAQGTVGKLQLPPGKYAIVAKITIDFIESDSDAQRAVCRLIAESDVDEGRIGTNAGDDVIDGVISLTLLHEFADEGFVEMSCTDFGGIDSPDFADAIWSDLRITAIKLSAFQNGPLLQ